MGFIKYISSLKGLLTLFISLIASLFINLILLALSPFPFSFHSRISYDEGLTWVEETQYFSLVFDIIFWAILAFILIAALPKVINIVKINPSLKGLLLGAIIGLLASPVITIVGLFVYTSIFGPLSGEPLGLVYPFGLVVAIVSVLLFSILGFLKYKDRSIS